MNAPFADSPLTPAPQAHETVWGLTARHAISLGYWTPNRYLQACKLRVRVGQHLKPDDLRALAPHLGMQPEALEAHNPAVKHPQPSHNLSLHYRNSVHPICPDCVKEHGVLRGIWNHVLAPACPTHRRRLVDRCPHCEAPITLQRPELLVCGRCHQSLDAAAPTDEPPVFVLALSRWLAGEPLSADEQGALAAPMLEHGPQFADGLLWELAGVFEDSQHRARRGRRLLPSSVAAAEALIMQSLAPVLSDWPRGAAALIHQLDALSNRHRQSIRQKLASFVAMLQRDFNEPRFQWLAQDLAAHVMDHEPGLLTRKLINLAKKLDVDGGRLTLGEAASQLKVASDALRGAVEAGLVQATVAGEAMASIAVTFTPAQFQQLLSIRNEWLDATEARALLGVTKRQMERVIATQQVAVRAADVHPWLGHRRYRAADVNAILDRLRTGCRHEVLDDKRPVRRLPDIDVTRGRSEAVVLQMYAAVLSGAVSPVARVEDGLGVAAYVFDLAELVDAVVLTSEPLTVSAGEAALWLDIKGEDLLTMIRHGRLPAHHLSTGRGYMTTVAVRDLLLFAMNNTSLASIARDYGTSSRALEKTLESLGCRIDSSTRRDGARIGLSVRQIDLFAVLMAIPEEWHEQIRQRLQLLDFDGKRFVKRPPGVLGHEPQGTAQGAKPDAEGDNE